MSVSRETEDALRAYAAELTRWNRRINLVSPATIDVLWERHILDSLQLMDLAPKAAKNWLDLGSGAGLPGAVCAIAAHHKGTDTKFTCVESDSRKATFLRTIAQILAPNLQVKNKRLEDLPPQGADIISARALAPLTYLLAAQEQHGTSETIGLFPKGRTVHQEIEEAQSKWSFTYTLEPSKTSQDSFIVLTRNIARA